MNTTEVVIQTARLDLTVRAHEFSWLEKLFLKLFHPRSIFIEVAGMIWSIYFFWNYDWQMALSVFVASMVLAILVTLDSDYEKLSDTTLGKIALLHLHPVNFMVRFIGAALLCYGMWNRSNEFMLGGMSILFLGHVFGWGKVDSRFA